LCGAGGVVIYKYCDIAASLAACLVSQYCAVAGLAGGAFGVVLRYLARYGQSAPRIGGRVAAGGVSVRVVVSFGAGGAAYPPHPTPKTRPRDLGCLSKKFFLNFFIFAFVIEVFKPVGVVSSFAGFFSCKCPRKSLFS
jgi:hypothetical protein